MDMNASKIANKLFVHDHWKIGITHKKSDFDIFRSLPSATPHVQWLPEEQGHYYADPFLIEKNDLLYIFFEDYIFKSAQGSLAFMTFDGLSFGKKKGILSAPFHQSYPLIFSHQGDYYCLPEESANGKLILYKATKFPHQWEKCKVIIDRPCVDATIVHHENRWWIFCTMAGENVNKDLSLFWSDTLLGDWISHTQNPVRSDIASVRPAGKFFRRDYNLYRPAQDCSHTYGGDIVINRITHLSPTAFSEEFTTHTGSLAEKTFGVHTLSLSKNYIAFDVKQRASVREVLAKYQAYPQKRKQAITHNS